MFLEISTTAPTRADKTSHSAPNIDKPPANLWVTSSDPVWDSSHPAKLSPPNKASSVRSEAARSASGQAGHGRWYHATTPGFATAAITREVNVLGAVRGGSAFNSRSI